MTEKLYYNDAYIKEFYATVLVSEKCDGGFKTVLDKTAFFPEEGGQYADSGYIDGIRVNDVQEKDGIIYHYTDTPAAIGKSVKCTIDFDERYEKMQIHTAEHILSGYINKLFGLDNVGFHLGAVDVTMDVNGVLTRDELDRVEKLANEVVYKNVAVTTEFPTADELENMQYRSKLDLKDNVRIVKIGEYDSCACCAPHVRYTGEIGAIKILDFAKLRGGIRIFITAGRRAMRVFSSLFESALAISAKLSLPRAEIASGVDKLLFDMASLKNEYSTYRLSAIKKEAEKLPTTEGNAVVCLDGAEISELIEYSNVAISKVSGILVLLSGKDGDYKYVISSRSTDLRAISKDINNRLLGRGGGKENMIQGSFKSTLGEIKEYFNL